ARCPFHCVCRRSLVGVGGVYISHFRPLNSHGKKRPKYIQHLFLAVLSQTILWLISIDGGFLGGVFECLEADWKQVAHAETVLNSLVRGVLFTALLLDLVKFHGSLPDLAPRVSQPSWFPILPI
ncbi:unnamed protein product, partial [Pylaiella littoralis]